MKIFDSHNDLLSVVTTKQQVDNYFAKNKNAHIFCAYFSFNEDKNVNLQNIKQKFNWLSKQKRAVKSIENAWFVNTKNLENFVSLKPFCVGLCHNKKNNLCGGAFESGGFSEFGVFVAKELEKNKILIDTAHMNRKSFWEFSKFTQNPVFCSHTGFEQLCKHKRNLSEAQIRCIMNTKGYIGMALYPQFFTNKIYTVKRIVENILWFWEKFGTKTLGFGTDFNGIKQYPKGIKNYDDLTKIEMQLLKMGAKQEHIEGLFYKNLENFMLKAL